MIKTALVLIALFVSGVNAKEDSRISLEAFGGVYSIPGSLFSFNRSIVEHPDKLTGSVRGLRGSYAIDNHWFVGMQLFKIRADGEGPWARSDTAQILAKNGVTGVISGRTDWRLQGAIFEAEHRFYKEPVRPYVIFGGGLGELTVKFNGKFRGHEIISGFNFPVEEIAADQVKRIIPLVAVEGGFRFEITERLDYLMGAYWNTGWGGKLGFGYKF